MQQEFLVGSLSGMPMLSRRCFPKERQNYFKIMQHSTYHKKINFRHVISKSSSQYFTPENFLILAIKLVCRLSYLSYISPNNKGPHLNKDFCFQSAAHTAKHKHCPSYTKQKELAKREDAVEKEFSVKAFNKNGS